MQSIMSNPAFFNNVFVDTRRDSHSDISSILANGFPPTPPPESEKDIFFARNEPAEISLDSAPIVAVIGVGYVGTHLVSAFARKYKVIAFDVSIERLKVVAQDMQGLPIDFTAEASRISEASHFLISVPTILKDDKSIDATYLRAAIDTVEKYARPGSTIVVESSVAVGMTRQLVGPLMNSKKFKVGMSPERVDPGRTCPTFQEIPKIVSGIDQESLDSIKKLYSKVFETILPVSSPEVAEMTKLYENCQRMVCAAYANEMADACECLGIDPLEVSGAAASKPFGYLPFRPGPGVGGHCIPVNPYYLLSTCSMPLLQHATTMSWERPAEIATRFAKSMLCERKPTSAPSSTSRIFKKRALVVGVGFKRGQSVMSNSSGVAIARTLLSDWDLDVEFADPLVSSESLNICPKMNTDRDWNTTYLSKFDGIIVAVDQVGLDMGALDELKNVQIHNYTDTRKDNRKRASI